MAKRYVLFVADAVISEADRRQLEEILEERHGKVKLISVEGNPRAVIVKTTNEVAPLLRDPEGMLSIAGKSLRPILTSGAVANLKRRGSEPAANGKIHE